ncbi:MULTISPECIES: helix-turn-helix domain-containing protein [Kocuria]|uniref:helix-turn-helix domain-containing protein n=1 Tax=Kocuria TaxID=57493 RepID=UPI00037AF74A|nr:MULTISPECIES: helix-turn-helix domain-containing protein [Kocuria]EYT55567.1 AraC family transcriptional regulator [Kocuria sp. UCD-OTCP]MCM3486685.1 helix-turn-helix domain-containing protein [Kocuria rosea]PWF84586.1 AraC family transcriptional regulator [Kocuria rosea]STX07229.1 DNA-binding transcriptional activator FeaR [Kocuria rosea]VEH41383.1 DNA-binding transcriptional activator FeaR [Kocuria rosea]
MSEPPTTRGHLTPGPHATVVRLPAPDDVAHLVRQLWIPEWDLPAGERAEQLVLGYPASNVVVEPDGVALHGPTSRASTRVLTGRGWAVGALLRPAGVLLFTEHPADLLDGSAPVSAPGLRSAVAEAMAGVGPAGRRARPADPLGGTESVSAPGLRAAAAGAVAGADPAGRHLRAASLLADHVRTLAAGVPPSAARDGALANRMVDLLEAGTVARSPAGLARQLHVSERSLQRLAARFVGMPPQLLLRRRRLQEAAERMRADPAADLGALAAELGFADQSHLTREFRSVLGATPRGYGRARSGREGG